MDTCILFVAPTRWHDHDDVEKVLFSTGADVACVDSLSRALFELERREIAMCVIDLRSPDAALPIAAAIRQRHMQLGVVGIVDALDGRAFALALRVGAFEVLQEPVHEREVVAVLSNLRERTRRCATDLHRVEGGIRVLGAGPAMQAVKARAQRAAAGDCPVLIVGEPGTERETIARAIHEASERTQQPFVAMHCDRVAAADLEHVLSAAPDGSGDARRGRTRVAAPLERGTLYLEHLHALPGALKQRIAATMNNWSEPRLVPCGGQIRVMAGADATAQTRDAHSLELFGAAGVCRITIPPLRHRREDIPALAASKIREACDRRRVALKTLTRPAITVLAALPWTGNVRELERLMGQLVAASRGGVITLEDVLSEIEFDPIVVPAAETLRDARARFERDFIGAALRRHRGRIGPAADALGLQRSNLYRKLKQLDLDVRRRYQDA